MPEDIAVTGPDAVLAGLDPEQREVALAVRGPVCVLAGAGTGKTRAITHRIAYAVHTGVVDPARVLALTFTTRAAGELRGRLSRLGTPDVAMDQVQACTFHAAALRQLTYFWPRTVGGRPPRVLDSKVRLLADAARDGRVNVGRAELREVAAEIEWAKVTQVRPEDYAAEAAKSSRTPPVGADELARLYGAYERLRRDRHLVDFESVLELTAAILADHRQAAQEVRDQYRYFVVDEYQDVNPLQKLLLDAWLGDRNDLCVVGDPHQTIYSFTGATPGYLTGFTAEFADATVIRLVRDYRSTPQVVTLANRLLRPGIRGGTAGTLVGQRPPGPEPVFTEYGDEQEEAEGVAGQVRVLVGGGLAARQVAVLVRANAQTQSFERAFAEAGVPYQVRGAERFFDRREVRQAVALLRTAARQEWPDSAAGQATARELTQEVRDVLSGLGLTARPPAGGGPARERWESLSALAQLADDLAAARHGVTLADFAAELIARATAQDAPVLEGVTLASLHAAKGLEWDAVFLPGLVDGMVPITYAQTPEEIEEERRLLYVGVTRARERVHLSWAVARSPGGRQSRRPSRFLDGIRPDPARQGQDEPGSSASGRNRR